MGWSVCLLVSLSPFEGSEVLSVPRIVLCSRCKGLQTNNAVNVYGLMDCKINKGFVRGRPFVNGNQLGKCRGAS